MAPSWSYPGLQARRRQGKDPNGTGVTAPRISVQYFKSEGALHRPNGAVLVEQCTVSAREESAAADGSLRWGFALVHPCGDTLVLA